MYLVAPTGRKRKWDIRIRNHDGRLVKISGDRDKGAAQRLGMRIETLLNAKSNGDAPPKELSAWINNMPARLARRLTALGLIDGHRFQQSKSLDQHIDDFEETVAARKGNPTHATQQANRVRRVCRELHAGNLLDLTVDSVLKFLAKHVNTVATRHHYVIALKDFSSWMKQGRRSIEDPLADFKAPGQYEDPSIERCPLKVAQFKALLKYLATFTYYPRQRARWTARDRRLIYWTAVKTGFREQELMSLRAADVHLDQTPATISIKAANAKNKTAGSVPIPADLAAELKRYIAGREPADPLFPIPRSNHTIVATLRRDLEGANIPWDLTTGERRGDHVRLIFHRPNGATNATSRIRARSNPRTSDPYPNHPTL